MVNNIMLRFDCFYSCQYTCLKCQISGHIMILIVISHSGRWGKNNIRSCNTYGLDKFTPLYLCPLVDEKLDYEKVFAPVLNNGAVLIRNTTVFTAYAKLVYGYGDRRFREYLNHNYVFEDITNIL